MVAIQTGSPVSSHSPTMVGPSTPAPRKDGRMDTCGAAQLQITSKTRSILSVQTIPVSVLGETRAGRRSPSVCQQSIINCEAAQETAL